MDASATFCRILLHGGHANLLLVHKIALIRRAWLLSSDFTASKLGKAGWRRQRGQSCETAGRWLTQDGGIQSMQSLCYTEGVGCALASASISFHIKEVLCTAMILFRSPRLQFLARVFVCLPACLFLLCNSSYFGHNSTWGELQFQKWGRAAEEKIKKKEKKQRKRLAGEFSCIISTSWTPRWRALLGSRVNSTAGATLTWAVKDIGEATDSTLAQSSVQVAAALAWPPI